jgi:hypothetical protein
MTTHNILDSIISEICNITRLHSVINGPGPAELFEA